ncbi:MAG: hypothetical protein SangKO_070150 [Sandaracinaceae bacterium]
MTMNHRAFGFRWNEFSSRLEPTLREYLRGNTGPLVEYATTHISELADPDEETRLTSRHLAESVRTRNFEFVADACITRYYDVTSDVGVGDDFLHLSRELAALGSDYESLLLGFPIREDGVSLDRGKMGTYFSTSEDVTEKKTLLESIGSPQLTNLIAPMLEAGEAIGGLYVTF